MPKEINFLRERRKGVTAQEKSDRRMLLLSSVVFGIALILFFAAFIGQLYLNGQLNDVLAQQKNARSQIVLNQDLERSFVIFSHKLTSLTQLFQDRLDKKEAIAYFSSVFGPDILIKQIDFDRVEKLLVFRIQAGDIFKLQNVFNIVNSPQTQSRFASVNASNLSRLRDGKYEMNIVISTKKMNSGS